jgi:hypothetical protein
MGFGDFDRECRSPSLDLWLFPGSLLSWPVAHRSPRLFLLLRQIRNVTVGRFDRSPLIDLRAMDPCVCVAGPLVDVNIPRDKDKENRHRGYAFAEYKDVGSAHYAIALFSNNVALFNRKLRINVSPFPPGLWSCQRPQKEAFGG